MTLFASTLDVRRFFCVTPPRYTFFRGGASCADEPTHLQGALATKKGQRWLPLMTLLD